MPTLYIKPLNEKVKSYYQNHEHYHKGDSGLDLYLPEQVEIKLGETIYIDLGIQCQMVDCSNDTNVSYYLYPRSSFSKYPLVMGNHVGIIDSGYRGNIKACVKYLPHSQDISYITKNLIKSLLEPNSEDNIESIEEINDEINNNLPKITIPAGTRLFQICSGNLEPFEFQIKDSLDASSRGEGGFGSTGN